MIEKAKNDMFKVGMSGHKELMDRLKLIKDKKFNPFERSWFIHRKDLSYLVGGISDNSIIDHVKSLVRLPLKHQDEAKEFLLREKKAILADDMGGGKTFSSIISGHAINGKKLVICPASLKYNWQKEIRLATDADVEVIDKDWKEIGENGWHVINYDLLEKYKENIREEGYSVMICDEAHYFRSVDKKGNPKSVRAKIIFDIYKLFEYRFLLTGTPIVNSVKDIYLLLKIVEHPISNSFSIFMSKYGNKNRDILYDRLQIKMLRRLKHEFINLPNKDRRFVPTNIDLTKYHNIISEYQTIKKNEDNVNYLVYLNKMRQEIAKQKVGNTIKLSDELLDKGKPVVIFTNYDYVVNKIVDHYGDRVVKVTGKDSGKNRSKSVDKFQNGEADVIVCNMIAGSEGLTLIRSSDLIVNDFDWIPARHMQSEDRVHRIGQDKEVTIYYMYSMKTIDEKMANMLEYKLKDIKESIDGEEDSSFMNEFLQEIS